MEQDYPWVEFHLKSKRYTSHYNIVLKDRKTKKIMKSDECNF